jgi:AcrR family transcriptional regulator
MLVTNIMRVSKSDRTRAHLQTVALRIIGDQGYASTTVDQIASAAGVSSMTFFRHFPTKAHVVLDDPYDPIIGDAVAGQDASLAPLERACRGVATAWARVPEPERDDTWERVSVVASNPELRAQMWENTLATQQIIARALEGPDVSTLQAEIAAGACMGAVIAALLDWGRSDVGGLGDRIAYALDQLAPQKVAS